MISQLWRIFASDGLSPYKAIEQLSYLLALKLLARDDYAGRIDRTTPSPTTLWGEIAAASDGSLLERARNAIVALRTGAYGGQTLFHTASLAISHASLLQEVVVLVDRLFSPTQSGEWHAHIYDALLAIAEQAAADWATPGGKFYTPAHLAHLLCTLVRPQPGEKICDYTCGNGNLLAAAYAQIIRSWCNSNELLTAFDGQPLPQEGFHQWTVRQRKLLAQTQLVGIDIDGSAVLQAWVRLRCLGIKRPSVSVLDTLSDQIWNRSLHTGNDNIGFDVLLANPPYGSRIDNETLDASLRGLNTSKAELLFVARALQLLRPGGRAAIIVPDSVLFHQGRATVALRQTLITEHELLDVS
jgi:type I restriction enzyme M protein